MKHYKLWGTLLIFNGIALSVVSWAWAFTLRQTLADWQVLLPDSGMVSMWVVFWLAIILTFFGLASAGVVYMTRRG